MQIVMGAFAAVMLINAFVGVEILSKLYNKNTSNRIIVENMIDQEEEQVKDEEHNERLPSILRSNELLEKLFNNGWKFDLFNASGKTIKTL